MGMVKKQARYTQEEHDFFHSFVPGHSHKEIQAEFIKRFGWDITVSQVKSYIGIHKLNTGRTGRFAPGNIPHNTGKKGVCAPGSEKGWFKKGTIPPRYHPVGTERVEKDGYVWVKVADPKTWKQKHRYVWEQAHGEIPKGYIVSFKDGNRKNCDLDNLMLLSRSTNMVINHDKILKTYRGDFRETAAYLADLKSVQHKAEKKLP